MKVEAAPAIALFTSMPIVGDPEVVIGAVAGSLIFMLSPKSHSSFGRIFSFSLSFIGGVLSCNTTSRFLEKMVGVEFDKGLCALIASATILTVVDKIMTIAETRKVGDENEHN